MSFHKTCFEQRPKVATKIDRVYANLKIKKNDWYKEDHGKLMNFVAFVEDEEIRYITTKKAYDEDWRKVTLDFRDIIAETFQKHRLVRQKRK